MKKYKTRKPKKDPFKGRLPNSREMTTDPQFYANSWREFARPIAELINARPFGYENGVTWLLHTGQPFWLPEWFVAKINDAIRGDHSNRLLPATEIDIDHKGYPLPFYKGWNACLEEIKKRWKKEIDK